MSARDVVITTSYLGPDDEVHEMLVAAGLEVIYSRPQDRDGDLATMAEAIAGAAGLIAGTEPVSAAAIEAAPDLKVIARTGVGYDNVDVAAARARGVVVCTTPGANADSVAELALGLMIDCARRVTESSRAVLDGQWQQRSGHELKGATLGIIGLGGIGRRLAVLARAFGMTVVAHDTYFDETFATSHEVSRSSLPDLLTASDFVSVHTALTPQTRHLIDAAALAMMKPTAILVNTARGGIVDEIALAEALHSGTISGAALDVLETEPAAADHPLRTAPGCVITPHIAGATFQARARSGALAAAQVMESLRGGVVAHEVTS
ncbi:phosphoglycerate dehydrogenase [Pseudactinotalea terrae]|uniref:phosphoglycerate dehydrogenase n=1 Tax=Pseudactinotalea terrae TaxID=1743262 RepID=UPI0012E2F078|nr:phosphoglycerate dehydrogenase [Pseudactinotalea terrae]